MHKQQREEKNPLSFIESTKREREKREFFIACCNCLLCAAYNIFSLFARITKENDDDEEISSFNVFFAIALKLSPSSSSHRRAALNFRPCCHSQSALVRSLLCARHGGEVKMWHERAKTGLRNGATTMAPRVVVGGEELKIPSLPQPQFQIIFQNSHDFKFSLIKRVFTIAHKKQKLAASD
jgi:hypothetical protein